MKKATLILSLIYLIFPNCHAQKFIDQTKVWIVATEVLSNYHYGPPTSEYWKFFGDTIVADKKYTKMYYSINQNQTNWHLNTLWREDEQGKVYRRDYKYDYGEELMYNFNLSVGDTVKNIYKEMETVVDSIFMKPFGVTTKKYLYTHLIIKPSHIITWIEGVGSLWGPNINDDFFISGGRSTLICFEENGVLVYHNPNYPNCFFTSSQSLEDDQDFIDLFSMQNGEIQIRLKNNTRGKLFLYTVDGKQVLNKEISLSTTTICAPTGGILLYRFVGKGGEVQTGKVMVK
jgi:hypothetical protein